MAIRKIISASGGSHVGITVTVHRFLSAQDDPAADRALERAAAVGRPLGTPEWIADLERRTGLALAPRKPGPRPKPSAAIASISRDRKGRRRRDRSGRPYRQALPKNRPEPAPFCIRPQAARAACAASPRIESWG